MTIFEIPTLTTDRLRLRAFRATDLDAYAAMQANPEVMRYLITGRTSPPVEVWRTMATFLGQWALRRYGKNRRQHVSRKRRHLPAIRLAGTGNCVFARSALLATGLCDRSSGGGARVVVRTLSLASGCKLHSARQSRVEAGRGTPRSGLRTLIRIARLYLRVLGSLSGREALLNHIPLRRGLGIVGLVNF